MGTGLAPTPGSLTARPATRPGHRHAPTLARVPGGVNGQAANLRGSGPAAGREGALGPDGQVRRCRPPSAGRSGLARRQGTAGRRPARRPVRRPHLAERRRGDRARESDVQPRREPAGVPPCRPSPRIGPPRRCHGWAASAGRRLAGPMAGRSRRKTGVPPAPQRRRLGSTKGSLRTGRPAGSPQDGRLQGGWRPPTQACAPAEGRHGDRRSDPAGGPDAVPLGSPRTPSSAPCSGGCAAERRGLLRPAWGRSVGR